MRYSDRFEMDYYENVESGVFVYVTKITDCEIMFVTVTENPRTHCVHAHYFDEVFVNASKKAKKVLNEKRFCEYAAMYCENKRKIACILDDLEGLEESVWERKRERDRIRTHNNQLAEEFERICASLKNFKGR